MSIRPVQCKSIVVAPHVLLAGGKARRQGFAADVACSACSATMDWMHTVSLVWLTYKWLVVCGCAQPHLDKARAAPDASWLPSSCQQPRKQIVAHTGLSRHPALDHLQMHESPCCVAPLLHTKDMCCQYHVERSSAQVRAHRRLLVVVSESWLQAEALRVDASACEAV